MQRNGDMTFGGFLSIILRHGQMYIDRELEPLHIRSGQILILRFLGVQDGVNQESIRRYFHLDKGTITKAIRPLITEGYIIRKRNPDDRRAYQIFLTEKGRRVIPNLKKTVRRWIDVLTADFTDTEEEVAYDLLSRMSDNAHQYLEQYRSQETRKGHRI